MSEDALRRAEELLEKLEATRAELERVAQGDDVDRAVDVLAELAELAREVEQALSQAKVETDAES